MSLNKCFYKKSIFAIKNTLMKHVFISLFLVFSLSGYSQSLELRSMIGIGFSEQVFAPHNNNWLQHNRERAAFGTPIDLQINYTLLHGQKFEFFLGTGVGYRSFRYVESVEALELYSYSLDEISFNERYISIPAHFGVEFNLTDYVSFGLQYSLGYNLALSKNQELVGAGQAVFETVEYEYVLSQNTSNNWSHTVGVFTKARITQHTSLLFGLDYEMINNGSYSYRTEQDFFLDGEWVLNQSYEDGNNYLDHNYLNFKIGLAVDL
jgi:hypothetical protein